MNSRNVATKEIVSTLESEHGSASDISTRPEKSEHSGWQSKKQNKPEQLKQKKNQQQIHRMWTRKARRKKIKVATGRRRAASCSASSLGAARRKPTITARKRPQRCRDTPPTHPTNATSSSPTLALSPPCWCRRHPTATLNVFSIIELMKLFSSPAPLLCFFFCFF